MAIQERQETEDDRLALAIGKYVLGELTFDEAAAFARVDTRVLADSFDSEQVFQVIEFAEQLREQSRTGTTMVDVPAGTALGESSPLDRYRSAKESAQARVAENDVDESIVEDAIEWARTG